MVNTLRKFWGGTGDASFSEVNLSLLFDEAIEDIDLLAPALQVNVNVEQNLRGQTAPSHCPAWRNEVHLSLTEKSMWLLGSLITLELMMCLWCQGRLSIATAAECDS
jgi:hypothetical protein